MGGVAMKFLKKLSALVLMLTIIVGMPKIPQARVMMTGSIIGFGLDILPKSNFTIDDWLTNPSMWMITITNSDTKTVKSAYIDMEIVTGTYGTVLTGRLTVVGERHSFLIELAPGQSYTINNTMLTEGTEQLSGGEWSQEFKNEVLRIGALPEGSYSMKFTLHGYYETTNDPLEEQVIDHNIIIKNPSPPELMTPDDTSDNAVAIQRFTWQRPLVSDLSSFKVQILYNITVWKMFGTDGSILVEEDAINRIPIWSKKGLLNEFVDFDPGTAREELVPGKKYCWQVQAVDGSGRPICVKNNGKSDVWDFTVQFKPPRINEPLSFNPFGFTFTAAQAGGSLVLYRIRIADNPDFAGGYRMDGLVMTSFTYPQDAPPLRMGVNYNLELQATDSSGIPIGDPATTTFTIPVSQVTLRSPADGTVSSTATPRFMWQGTSPYYVVMIYEEGSDWNYISHGITQTSWLYDGEDLRPGMTYGWNVSPANTGGDPVGESSPTWYFSLTAEGQVALVSPVDTDVENINPTFTWKAVSAPSGGGTVEYNIIVTDGNISTIHSATVTSTSYQYPQDAPALDYTTRYLWSVNAEMNNTEIAKRSESASFTTPLAAPGTQVATTEDVSKMIVLILTKYPQYADFQEKILASISDNTGPLTPAGFIQLLDTFNIKSVSSR